MISKVVSTDSFCSLPNEHTLSSGSDNRISLPLRSWERESRSEPYFAQEKDKLEIVSSILGMICLFGKCLKANLPYITNTVS